jgi:alkyl sulfatase BDS1-like metallo-beta-lactamase superfamily hydrolase
MRYPCLAAAACIALASGLSLAQEQDTAATRQLKARSAEFERAIIKVTDNVYTAIGWGVSTITMIVGDGGVIFVDAGSEPADTAAALVEFRKISAAPIAALIYTHSHNDHTNGAPALAAQGPIPQVWAGPRFQAEDRAFETSGIKFAGQRGIRQAGFRLPPEKRINNGIAPAVYPSRPTAGFGFNSGQPVLPNRFVGAEAEHLVIAGVEIELSANPGETDDQLYVWLPRHKVIFSGDNFYKSWPNLYAIRGTPYRDVQAWAASVDRLLQKSPEYLVGGHTRPVLGRAAVTEVLTDYRDAIRFVFDRTVQGINLGLTPDQLVEYVQLPSALADKDYLRPYYGDPEWAVRSIFAGYLGWFDGNPTNLFPLRPRQEAEHIARLAGGPDRLLEGARTALASGDAQWTAQLCDYLLALDFQVETVRRLKADALDALAPEHLNSLARNYYQTVAEELRSTAAPPPR